MKPGFPSEAKQDSRESEALGGSDLFETHIVKEIIRGTSQAFPPNFPLLFVFLPSKLKCENVFKKAEG